MLALLVVENVPITHNRRYNDAYGCFIAEDLWSWRVASTYAPLWAAMLIILASSAVTLCQLTALLPSCHDRNQRLKLRRVRRKVWPMRGTRAPGDVRRATGAAWWTHLTPRPTLH